MFGWDAPEKREVTFDKPMTIEDAKRIVNEL